jgi:ATP-dependent exoDNAse (exonuclease V) beta subunit
MQKHISFSELKTWNECPYKQKLAYIDRVSFFEGNEYTAFGTAIHEVCEKSVLGEIDRNFKSLNECFDVKFLEELKNLTEKNINLDKNLVKKMRSQASTILPYIIPSLITSFKEYEVVSAEEKLYETIENSKKNFKGYIDLVIKTKDGKYHIIDWKTCSWGWDSKKKSDSMTTYQLTLYKHFFAKKHSIDPKNIETHFALLKRTAKSDNKVEIFRVTSGLKKTENALKLLNKALYNIEKNKFIKNRLSCTSGFGCEFYKTKFCS